MAHAWLSTVVSRVQHVPNPSWQMWLIGTCTCWLAVDTRVLLANHDGAATMAANSASLEGSCCAPKECHDVRGTCQTAMSLSFQAAQ